MTMKKKYKISIIGLGYVGLPLAVEFSKKFKTIGFDINSERISQLKEFTDNTLEISENILQSVSINDIKEFDFSEKGFYPTDNLSYIEDSNIYIITVPTPIDKNKRPILDPLIKASKMIGSILSPGDIVVYESTVYPGVTEEVCAPILETNSGLKLNKDFFIGYSPERINPGDKKYTISKILKITSGSTLSSAKEINELYKKIIVAGTYLAPTIKVAEAAKVIENSQRDINIAFVNELAKIFNLLDIDTSEVLKAASTKWNFLNFKPGLVGGHCIGVDPYYLAQKAQEVGYHPEIILAGRRLNDSMGTYVSTQVIKLMINKNITIRNSNILVLGITFKENCPDIRNTKAIDIVNELQDYNSNITIYDPWASIDEVKNEYNLQITNDLPRLTYDVILLAVAHDEYLDLNIDLLRNKNSIVYDVKGVLGEKADFKL
jgi:UDP-N-acetyl-D-glucosamine/UDP-N-acetyl-D-galactosamine dehydrogenase